MEQEPLFFFRQYEVTDVLGQHLLARVTVQATACFVDLCEPPVEVRDEDAVGGQVDNFTGSRARILQGIVPAIKSQGGYTQEEQTRDRSHVR